MKLEFISNACEIFYAGGKKLLCDPWLTEGAFEGSWWHWPPLKTKPEDVSDYDYLYISHIDPDHFDPATLNQFDKSKPVIILKFEHDYLGRSLRSLGFTNIIEERPEVPFMVGPFKLTLFAPFQKTRLGDEAMIGNVIDSAILVEADGEKVLNTVDNLPDFNSAVRLQERFGPFSIVQLNYNSAGPYPDCFIQYREAERKFRADKFLEKQLKHLFELSMIFEGAAVQPFAGDYVLVGEENYKNFFNATCSPEYAKVFVEDMARDHALKAPRFLLMKENETIDVSTVLTSIRPLPPSDEHSRFLYGSEHVDEAYPHEKENLTPTKEQLEMACRIAYEKLKSYGERWRFADATTVIIEVEGFRTYFSFDWKDHIHFDSRMVTGPYLYCTMDSRLLWRLLHRTAQWNNAEIGAHISFRREPDVYKKDVHMLLNFFHV